MSGSTLKRKQPEQLEQAAVGAEGTAAAGPQPVGVPQFREAPNPAQQTQQPKKHKAPQLEARMQDGQQPGVKQGQQPGVRQGQQPGQQLEASHDQVPQQQAPNCGQQQLELPPPLPRAQVQQREAVVTNGQMAERPVQPPAVLPLQQQQRQQQASRQGHVSLAAEPRAGAAPPAALHPSQQGQRYATQPPRQQQQQRQQPQPRQQPLQQSAQALPLPQPPRLPLAQVVPWQQPPAVWPTAAAALGWAQPPQQLWEQQQQQQQQQAQQQAQQQQLQAVPVWDPSMGPAWDPVQQQWATAPAAGLAQQHAQQQAQQQQQVQQQQWASGAAAAPSHPGLGWQAQAAALQQQLGAQQQGIQPPPPQGQPQVAGQGQHTSKLQRDVPPGGPAEALLRLAVRICCQRLGLGEHDGKQLGKVLGELDRNWRTSTCSGHSVSVLLKELDRRGLVVTREDTSGGKRICYFRNIAC